jgi:hypothetical protein
VKQDVHVKRKGFGFVHEDHQESTVGRDVVTGHTSPCIFGNEFAEQLPFGAGRDPTRTIERHFEDSIAGRRRRPAASASKKDLFAVPAPHGLAGGIDELT